MTNSQQNDILPPGVPADLVRRALARIGGNEIASGKLAGPESSAALDVNTLGWFIEQQMMLPTFPDLDASKWLCPWTGEAATHAERMLERFHP
jgi:hypothetical protein